MEIVDIITLEGRGVREEGDECVSTREPGLLRFPRVNHSHARTRARKWGKEGGGKNKGDRYGWMEEGISTLVGGHAREDINVVRWR